MISVGWSASGMKLLTYKFTKGMLSWHRLRFLRVGELMLSERMNGVAQYVTVQRILALKVVIYRGLIDASLRRKGAYAGSVITAFGE